MNHIKLISIIMFKNIVLELYHNSSSASQAASRHSTARGWRQADAARRDARGGRDTGSVGSARFVACERSTAPRDS